MTAAGNERPPRHTGTGKKVRMTTDKQERGGQEGPNRRETSGYRRKKFDVSIHNKTPHHALKTERAYPSLVTWLGRDIDTGAYLTVFRPDIAAGWRERQPNQRYTQMVSVEAVFIVKEVFLTPWGGPHS
jgi:hypothetical protein